jgi:hypothetical protein
MNGSSLINAKYVPANGQARIPGIKTALQRLVFGELANTYGDLSLPGVGTKTESGGRYMVPITGNEDFILSASDVKNLGIRYEGRTYDQIVADVKKKISQGGVSYSKTAEEANGQIRWVSGQLAQILGDTPEFQNMATKAFLQEYIKAGTLGGINSVFADESELRQAIINDPTLLETAEVQRRIANYRASLVQQVSRGDMLMPKELEKQRAMAAPYIFNAINNTLRNTDREGRIRGEEGFEDANSMWNTMTDKEKEKLSRFEIKDDEVLFRKMVSSTLGVARYPATVRSAQKAVNVV